MIECSLKNGNASSGDDTSDNGFTDESDSDPEFIATEFIDRQVDINLKKLIATDPKTRNVQV